MRPEMRKYARVAWTFLNAAGYINFGVAPAMSERIFKKPPARETIIVIGAGLAGAPCLLQQELCFGCMPYALSRFWVPTLLLSFIK